MKYRYYHNEACSKSRAALALLTAAGVSVECVRYLEQVPTAAEIVGLAQRLAVPVHELVRSNEAEYAEFAHIDVGDDAAWAAAIQAQPRLLQRPILLNDVSAVICRPPELALTWLAQQGHERA
ncbi:arsenate reductase (glutaredoxin) [Vitreoscilla massiliensis]|uniref:Arsenate reductase (Glutaredoxin) n=1 Tax=Vitreoscilla massiliensis TaxID=1689272 RepID=A0ABY4E6B7_9NEIS|nr:ArsC/Spx/MgsR family protein [Vitreoscilla massiliensis]UOO90992.1 arsenate reductase (glutaredoxin) [Vitreoscilla massiliensis]